MWRSRGLVATLVAISLWAMTVDSQTLRKGPPEKPKNVEVDVNAAAQYVGGAEMTTEKFWLTGGSGNQVKCENGTLRNWGASYFFKPAVVYEAYTYDDVVKVVKDTATYPSPVRALGKRKDGRSLRS